MECKFKLKIISVWAPMGMPSLNIQHCIKFQHVTSSIRISPSCSNVSVLISWIGLQNQWTWSGPKMCWLYQCKKKQWDILQVGVSNQQPYLAIVISVGILDNFQRMSMSDHMEVRWLHLMEEEHPPLLLMEFEIYPKCMEWFVLMIRDWKTLL